MVRRWGAGCNRGKAGALCRSLLKALFGFSVAVSLFAGCAGAPGAPSHAASSCPKARVYIGSYTANVVRIYPQGRTNPAPCGAITEGISGPLGLAVDTAGTLFVANVGNDTIAEYARNATVPERILRSRVRRPSNVVVGRDGTVYVSELAENAVLEFSPGADSPTRALAIRSPEGAAVDAYGDLYVSHNGPRGRGAVEKFAPQAIVGKEVIRAAFSGDAKLANGGAILLGAPMTGRVDVYLHGKGAPYRSIPTPRNFAFNFALDRTGNRLYVGSGDAVRVYDFHSGRQVGAIGDGAAAAFGVALDPPAPYAAAR